MAYAIDGSGRVPDQLRAVIEEQVALARGLLAAVEGDSNEAIHDARRAIRRLRAMFALLEPALGDRYEIVRAPYREASHLLSRPRDAHTVIEALDRLRGKRTPEGLLRLPSRLRSRLERRCQRAVARAQPACILASGLLEAALAEVPGWVDCAGADALDSGLAASRRRTRRALDRACEQPGIETYHRLRRRLRDLALQLTLLDRERERREVVGNAARRLGRERELLLLRAALTRYLVPTERFDRAAVDAWRKELNRRRRKLRLAALATAKKGLRAEG